MRGWRTPPVANLGIESPRLWLYHFLYICCRIEEEIAMVTAVAYTNFRKAPESYLCRVEPRTHGDVICTGDLGQEDTRTHQRVDARYDMFPVRGYGQV